MEVDISRPTESRISVAAFFSALGTMLSRILGYLREIVVVHYFGRAETDAWFQAFLLPNMFRRIFGEGALTVSFVPVLTDFLNKKDFEGARKLTSAVFTLLFIVLSLITVIFICFADPLVRTIASGKGFSEIPGKLELTVTLTQISFAYVLLVSLYAFVMGVLNTARQFFLPAFAPALFNVAMVFGAVFFRLYFEVPVQILAWSALAGGVLQLAILLPSFYRLGYRFNFVNFIGVSGVKRILQSFAPSLIGLSVLQMGVLINAHFASQLEQGSRTWLALADRLLELPLSLIAVSLGTASLPSLAQLWSQGKKQEMAETSSKVLLMGFFLTVPTSIAVFYCADQIVHLLYHYGLFSTYDAQKTADVTRIYAAQILLAGGVRVLAPSFYAAKITWLPAVSALTAITVHIFTAPILMKSMGLNGLVLSSIISSSLNFAILLISVNSLIGKMSITKLIKDFSKMLILSFMIIYPLTYFSLPLMQGLSKPLIFLGFVVQLGIGLPIYLILSRIVGLEQAIPVTEKILRKIKRQ